MVRSREVKVGKCRQSILDLIAAGPPEPWGVLVRCGCSFTSRVTPQQVGERCWMCHARRVKTDVSRPITDQCN